MKNKKVSEVQNVARTRNFNKMQLSGMASNLNKMINSGLLTEHERVRIIKAREILVDLIDLSYSDRTKAILSYYKNKNK